VRRSGIVTVAIGAVIAVGWFTPVVSTLYDTIAPTYSFDPVGDCREGSVDGGYVCQSDNATLTYYMHDASDSYPLESADRSMVNNVMTNQFGPTDLSISYDSTPSFSGTAETDVIYQEGTVPGSDNGMTWCNDDIGGWKCDQQYVRIEGAGAYAPGLTCHETGHAVGLVHGIYAWQSTSNDSDALYCMQKPVPSTTPLGTINRESINDVY
jgi:hypothetical protein